MVNLITTSAVKLRMGLPDVAASDPVIQSAIESAYLRVEAELDTKLDKLSNVDVFLLDKSKCGYVVPDGLYRLRLRRGFVRASPSMVVKVSESLDFTGADTITPQSVNVERGFVFVDEDHANKYVQVSYDSGFEVDTEAPAWLKEGLLSYVPVAFYMGQVSKKKDTNLPAIKASADHALTVLSVGSRTLGFSISPAYF